MVGKFIPSINMLSFNLKNTKLLPAVSFVLNSTLLIF